MAIHLSFISTIPRGTEKEKVPPGIIPSKQLPGGIREINVLIQVLRILLIASEKFQDEQNCFIL